MKTAITLAAIGSTILAGCNSGSSKTTSAQQPSPSTSPAYSVTIDPKTFSANVTNEWFPLKPGTTNVYRGRRDDRPALENFAISHETATVDGVLCRVVNDRLMLNGKLAENTRDYYAQDSAGNVWYFGEDTATFDSKGDVVSTDGTFHAGEAGALPGIFVPANPQVGQSGRQEYYVGHAEDFFEILKLSTSVTVPYKTFGDAMLTKEWTPLEPDVLDNKYYVRGIGTVKEVAVKGGQEELNLIDVKTSS